MPFQRHNEQITCWYCRLAFPTLFEPKPVVVQGVPRGDPKYSALLVLDDRMVQEILAIEGRLIQQSWPEWANGQPPPGIVLKRAMIPGEQARQGDPYLAGKWVLSANAQIDRKPAVVVRDAQGQFLPADPSQVYPGCEAHVAVGLYTTQIKVAEPQINVGLNRVELTGRQASSFGATVTNEQAFGGGPAFEAPPLEGGGDAPPPPPVPGTPGQPPAQPAADPYAQPPAGPVPGQARPLPWEAAPTQPAQPGQVYDPNDPTTWHLPH